MPWALIVIGLVLALGGGLLAMVAILAMGLNTQTQGLSMAQHLWLAKWPILVALIGLGLAVWGGVKAF